MTRHYIDVSDELANKLEQVADDDIIEVLTKLAEKETSEDELSAYDSVTAIREDDSISLAERKRLELKARRRTGFNKR